MHQTYFIVLGNAYLLLHKRLGKTKAHAKRFPTQFLLHTTDGGSQCIWWLESTEMNTAEVITQIRKHVGKLCWFSFVWVLFLI